MDMHLDFSSFLSGEKIDENTKRDLVSLFEFTQYLFDDDKNLTKTLNLAKAARDKLEARIKEMFETDLIAQQGTDGPTDDKGA